MMRRAVSPNQSMIFFAPIQGLCNRLPKRFYMNISPIHYTTTFVLPPAFLQNF